MASICGFNAEVQRKELSDNHRKPSKLWRRWIYDYWIWLVARLYSWRTTQEYISILSRQSTITCTTTSRTSLPSTYLISSKSARLRSGGQATVPAPRHYTTHNHIQRLCLPHLEIIKRLSSNGHLPVKAYFTDRYCSKQNVSSRMRMSSSENIS